MGRSGREWVRALVAGPVAVAVLAAAVVVVLAVLPPGTAAADGRPGWPWPLRPDPVVVRPAALPASPWLAGHRGVDLAAAAGDVVLAPAAGAVTFAGRVVDRGVLTIAHPGGLRSSLEPVEPLAFPGASVAAGQPVAVVTAEAGHCASTCLHWGVRRGQVYLDPLSLVRPPRPPVLLPRHAFNGPRLSASRPPVRLPWPAGVTGWSRRAPPL